MLDPLSAPIRIYYVTDWKMSAKRRQSYSHMGPQWRHSNPSGCGCSGSAALPLPELNHTSVTKPPDWRTVIWTLNAGDEMRGQTKLAHQRGESTLQAISCSSLQWIGSPTGCLFGCEKAGHISQVGRIGERGDPPMSLEFWMTKNLKAAEISVLADFTGLLDLSPDSRPLLWPLGLSITG